MRINGKWRQRWRDLPQASRDLRACVALVGAVYALVLLANLAEHYTAWAEKYEYIQFDEMPLVMLVTALAAVWFSRRRTVELSREIVRRADAERRSMITQTMYKHLFDEGLSGNFVATLEGRIVLNNEAFRAMCGGNPESLDLKVATGELWGSLVAEFPEMERMDFPELVLARPDHAPWIVMARFIRTSDHALGLSDVVHGYFVDITELHLAEQELNVLLGENRALSQRILRAQEDERRRIVREIHDDMGQLLTAIRLDAAALPRSPAAAAIHADRISRHVGQIQLAIRSLISSLRPMILDQHGLSDAVHHLVREWGRQHGGTQCCLMIDKSLDEGVPDGVDITAYRIIQEALTNIARHAGACRVDIELHLNDVRSDMIDITVRDDGCGFDPLTPGRQGFGLVGMRERAEAVGGTFRITSKRGSGAHVHVRLPLHPPTPPAFTMERHS